MFSQSIAAWRCLLLLDVNFTLESSKELSAFSLKYSLMIHRDLVDSSKWPNFIPNLQKESQQCLKDSAAVTLAHVAIFTKLSRNVDFVSSTISNRGITASIYITIARRCPVT